MLNLVTPVLLISIWVVFVLTKKVMTNLMALLLISLGMPWMFMQEYKLFWPCGILLILISTGLVVVFAYIVSLQESVVDSKESYLFLSLIMVSLLSMIHMEPRHSTVGSLEMQFNNVLTSLELSVSLIVILLFMVVYFVRLTYSKGGGFRNKF